MFYLLTLTVTVFDVDPTLIKTEYVPAFLYCNAGVVKVPLLETFVLEILMIFPSGVRRLMATVVPAFTDGMESVTVAFAFTD